MTYINLDSGYFDHPKTLRLVGLLGKGSEVLPIRLWCRIADTHSEVGKLTGYSTQEIESLVGWWGKSGECAAALVKVGFLGALDDGFQVHDWQDHNGHVYALHARAVNAAKARWGKLASDKQCLGDAPFRTSKQKVELEAKQKQRTATALIASVAVKKSV